MANEHPADGEHAAAGAAVDPRFASGLPTEWQPDEASFLRLSGFTERPRPAPPRQTAAMPAPEAPKQAPHSPSKEADSEEIPASARAFDAIVSELSQATEGEERASENLNRDSQPAVAAPTPPEDELLSSSAPESAEPYEAQRRLRDANVRLAEAERLLREIESQPRDVFEEQVLPEADTAWHSIRRFLAALLLLIFVVGLVAAASYALWLYYDDIVVLLNP